MKNNDLSFDLDDIMELASDTSFERGKIIIMKEMLKTLQEREINFKVLYRACKNIK